jgi:mannitol-1-phosphate 5-dehydrogenase
MKKAVMYGAGNIGRGFIGKVFSDSGYKVCFIDIDKKLIDAFNKDKEYYVKIVADDFERLEKVKNVYAVDANSDQAVQEIAECDIMATSVGVNALPYIVDNIAKGIRMRMSMGSKPLDIILAENLIDVDARMRQMIYEKLNPEEQKWAEQHLGLVEASIGRMVPPLTEEEREKSPLLIAVEPYSELPVDSLGFKGPIPDLVGLKPFTPFDFYIKRKLFLHNMGHAICAYLGWEKQYQYISEAIRDQVSFIKKQKAPWS